IDFNCSTSLTEGSYYTMLLDNGALIDENENPVLGITDYTSWNFTATTSIPQAGNCLNFDGNFSYVVIPNESHFDITGNMTIEAWIKVNEFTDNYSSIVTKGESSWRLQRYMNTNRLQFVAGGSILIGTMDVNDGNWHHVAAVKDGLELRLYIDGRLDNSLSCNLETPQNDFPVYIGGNSQVDGRFWNGNIDDVRIWQTARSEMEIRLHMHHPISEQNTNLRAYWKFDEETGSTLLDWTENSHHGTFSGNIQRIFSTAPIAEGISEIMAINTAGTYPLLDNDFIQVFASDFPTEIMLTRLDLSPNILPLTETTYSAQYWIFHNFVSDNNSISLGLTPIQQFETGNPLDYKLLNRNTNSSSKWHYAANATSISAELNFLFENISVDGQFIIGKETGSPVLYAKSPEHSSEDVSLFPEFTLTFSRNVIGGEGSIHIYDDSDNLVVSIPSIDTVIENETVSFVSPQNLELDSNYYVLVEPEAFTFFGNPFAGVNNSGEWSFSTLGLSNESGTCLELNGINDSYIIDSGLIPDSGDFTISLWAQADENQTGFREIVSQSGGEGVNFYIGMTNGGNIRCGDSWSDTGAPFPLDGGWHYYTVVKSSDDTRLYINGYLKASRGEPIGNPAGNSFLIGKQYDPYNEYFKGKIDEIKIWNRALSTHEVRLNMHKIAEINDEYLVSYFQFNDDREDVVDLISGVSGTGNGNKVESKIEIGDNEVHSIIINSAGINEVPDTGITFDVASISSEIHAYVTCFNHLPNYQVWGDYSFDSEFWTIHLFSDTEFTTGIIFQPSESIDSYYEMHPEMIYVNWREVYVIYPFWYSWSVENVNSEANEIIFSAFPSNGLYKLSCDIPVQIESISPPSGSVVPEDVVFEIEFDGWAEVMNEGYLYIHRFNDDTLFEQISLLSLPQNEAGNIFYVDPQNNLESGVTYYVLIDADCIATEEENWFGGIYHKDYWNFTSELGKPDNIEIEINSTEITISWDPVDNANSYYIYSANSPQSDNWQLVAQVSNPLYSEALSAIQKFFRVIASTDEFLSRNVERKKRMNTQIRR
ncbi:MAG: Ig-like domain-containing protein, partial [Candidatus Cloacimonetes bacterium]|nr:Ig-like domain-containing protein [Candidatus Cloacimonadota bacterium]